MDPLVVTIMLLISFQDPVGPQHPTSQYGIAPDETVVPGDGGDQRTAIWVGGGSGAVCQHLTRTGMAGRTGYRMTACARSKGVCRSETRVGVTASVRTSAVWACACPTPDPLTENVPGVEASGAGIGGSGFLV